MTATSTAAADPMLGTTVLGRYRIVRRLAVGGMGAVYLGRTEGAEGFTRPVVIKRVLPTLMGDREIAQMFVREAQILSHLQHPCIVSVIDFGQQDDDAYVMVLEYMHGYQLAEWMRYLRRSTQSMPVDFALHIILRVLDALHYAHTFQRSDGSQLKIIHRDVSPSNVLLSDTGLVKLLDFGIARVSGDETAFKTERPRVRGKMPYLALEIFKGDEPNERTDLYSAAVVLFEMLAGFNPFFGRETADIYYKILNTQVPSVHASRDDAPEEIDHVLAKALAKKAIDRYGSAAELATALRALRSAPEEVITQRLGERLRNDFNGPMQAAIGIETLAAREAAWRAGAGGHERPKPVEAARAPKSPPPPPPPPPPAIAQPPSEEHDAVTRHHSMHPELLAAAGAEEEGSLTPTSPPPAPFPGTAPAPRIPPAPLPSIAEPAITLAAPVAPSSVLASTRRIALVVVLAAVVGAISAAGFSLMMPNDGDDEQVVVIERQPRAPEPASPPSVTAAAGAGAPQVATTVAPSQASDAAVAAAATEQAAAPAAAAPLPPNPKRLTRAFGRRQKQIEACFATHAQALQGQPQIAVHFRIGERGQVIEAALSPEQLNGTALGACLLGVARGASFGPQQAEISFRIPITAQKVEP